VTFHPSGRQVYVAYRSTREIFRAGSDCKTLSDAMRAGTATWALDVSTLGMARARGVEWIVVLVRNSRDKWFTHISNYYDPHKVKSADYSRRGGANQKYLPLIHFRLLQGEIKI
tara:strand:+ start:3527 stop:3868 length:342 start_codon:yes stop_codon:yes gene_type:complete